MIRRLAHRLVDQVLAPQPLARLELLRILAPLTILGFMSSRIAHAPTWIGSSGFQVPDLGRDDWRQPLYLPPLPDPAAWALVAAMVASGLALSLGWRTRLSSAVFACTLIYVALGDRLSAFTVSKLGAVIAVALFFGSCGARYGVDAWRRRRRDPEAPVPTHVGAGEVRFFQLVLVVLYTASGACKARGEWLSHPDLLWSHLHDSYQTHASWWLANALPASSWGLFQSMTLNFEVYAPLWFAFTWTRPLALVYGLLLHALIAAMFGPLVWFSLLMGVLLVTGFAPERWLVRAMERLPG